MDQFSSGVLGDFSLDRNRYFNVKERDVL